jgi:O-antigen/teichoic acid export membrane protein
MKIQQYLAKLSWTGADKLLYIGYGFINLAQIKVLPTQEFAYYALLNALYLFIVSFSDISILQLIIRFGHDSTLRGWANRTAIFWHCTVVFGMSACFVIFRNPLAVLLHEPEFSRIILYMPLLCFAATPRMIALKFLYRDTQPKLLFIVNAVWFGTMTCLTFWLLMTHLLQSFWEMFWIACIGLTASSIIAVWFTRKQFILAINQRIAKKDVVRFIGYQGMTSFTSNSIKQLDIYLVQFFFGSVIVGIYQSAKTLFRFVEAIFDGINGLLYPGVVRLCHEKRQEELRVLLSKVVSFTLFIMLGGFTLSFFGGARYCIGLVLSFQYQSASGYFTILMIGAICMAFSLMTSVMAALDELRKLFVYMIFAGLAGFVTLLCIGLLHRTELVPLGFVVYHAVLGALSFNFIRQKMRIPIRSLIRALPDTYNFIRSRIFLS